jgi:hypothetical protein
MAKPRSPKKNANSNGTDVSSTAAAAGNSPDPINPSSTAFAETEAQKTARKTTRKPEIVRTDSRATLVPINVEDEIRCLAYLFSERRGFEPGHETDDWLAAEREVHQRYHQHSA